MWCSSAVNRTLLLLRAAWRTASSPFDALSRPSVRAAVVLPPFPSGKVFPSTASAEGAPSLFGCFIGTIPLSDFSSAFMLVVRLLPSRAGPACPRTRMRSPRYRTKDVSTCVGSATARGSSSASHLRGEDVAFSSPVRDRHLGIRPVYRGRDGDYSPPPARIRTGPTKTYGSYLEWVTRNRWSGHGCCTRGDGRKRSISRHIRSHVSRCR